MRSSQQSRIGRVEKIKTNTAVIADCKLERDAGRMGSNAVVVNYLPLHCPRRKIIEVLGARH